MSCAAHGPSLDGEYGTSPVTNPPGFDREVYGPESGVDPLWSVYRLRAVTAR
jgi:hypothetical protein